MLSAHKITPSSTYLYAVAESQDYDNVTVAAAISG